MPVAFLDLAQNCAPQIATETIAAVVSVESGFQPFAIRINTDRPLAEREARLPLGHSTGQGVGDPSLTLASCRDRQPCQSRPHLLGLAVGEIRYR